MQLNDIISALSNAVGVLILLILSFISIPKINLNVWEIIGKQITKDISGKIDNLETKVNEVEQKLDKHIEEDTEYKVSQARLRILRFSSELLHGLTPTKEHEENVIEDIDSYEDFCQLHPDYPNSKAVISIKHIKKDYETRLLTDTFLKE